MANVVIREMDLRNRPILVVADEVSVRWDLAWALHEAGFPAEQVASGDQARNRIMHGRLAGVVLDGVIPGLELDDLAAQLEPDPETGELPFVLAVPRRSPPTDVVRRVRSLLTTPDRGAV
jgi:CheY-like chemotaxis protein